uniref:Uncharacterized protein n=1 Tax=Glossina brevipalpis TaxID=37001 RepID=A0A1A9W6T8_9MUSC
MLFVLIILLIAVCCEAAPGPVHEEVVNYFNEKVQEIVEKNPTKIPENNGHESEFNEHLKKLNASYVDETNVVTATKETIAKIESALKEFEDYQAKRTGLDTALNEAINELEESLKNGIIPDELKDNAYKILLLMERSKVGKSKELQSSLKDYEVFKKSTKTPTTVTPMDKISVKEATTSPPEKTQPEISKTLKEILTTVKSFSSSNSSNSPNMNILGVLTENLKPLKDFLLSLASDGKDIEKQDDSFISCCYEY